MKIYLVVQNIDLGYEVKQAFFDKSKAQEMIDKAKEKYELYYKLTDEYLKLPESIEYSNQIMKGNVDYCAISNQHYSQWFAERGYFDYPHLYALEETEIE